MDVDKDERMDIHMEGEKVRRMEKLMEGGKDGRKNGWINE